MGKRHRHPLPGELVTHVTAICGGRGEAWLADLPRLIGELSTLWLLDVDPPFAAAEFNFVAPATMASGEAAVLKIAPPYEDREFEGEAEFLRRRNGRGTVKLLAQDNRRRAILIERAVPGQTLAELFAGREVDAIEPAIAVLKSILDRARIDRRPVKTVDEWFEGMRRADGTPFPAAYVAKAFEIYNRLSDQPGRTFFLHGDFHPANIVNAGRPAYLAIDPKGVVGHIGYDIAVFLNNFHWWQETKPDIHTRLDYAVSAFSEAFEIAAFELREWAYAQMVLGAWWSFEDMPQHYDNATVAKADIWNV